MKKPSKTSIVYILEWILSILFILEINSVFYNANNISFHITELIAICEMGMLFFSIIKIKCVKINVLIIILIYELMGGAIVVFSPNSSNLLSFIIKFLIFLPSMVLFYSIHTDAIDSIFIKMSDITFFLALMSLIAYILSFVLPPMGMFEIDWGEIVERKNYLFFYAGQYQEIFGQHYLRNTGIFSEAPMYGFVLVVALTTQLFFFGKLSKIKIIVLCLTILSTLSVMSIGTMGVIFAVKYYLGNVSKEANRNNKSTITSTSKKSLFKYVTSLIMFMVLIFIIYYLFEFKVNTGLSYSKRLDDFVAGFKAWKEHPWFGVGYGADEIIKNNMLSWRKKYSAPGYSNSVMYILASMGIVGGLFYISGFYWGIKKNLQNKEVYLAIQIGVIVILLFTTVVPMHLFILNCVAAGTAIRFSDQKTNA